MHGFLTFNIFTAQAGVMPARILLVHILWTAGQAFAPHLQREVKLLQVLSNFD